jgi:hypothetical protein
MHVLSSCALSAAVEKAQLSSLSLFNLSLYLSFPAVVAEIWDLIFRNTKQKQITSNSLLLITYINSVEQCTLLADLCVRALGLQSLDCWDRGFESHRGNDFSSFMFVWCCVCSGLRDGLITTRNVTAWCRITGCFEGFLWLFLVTPDKRRVMAVIAFFQIRPSSSFTDALLITVYNKI